MKQVAIFSAILVALIHCVSAGNVPSQNIASPSKGRHLEDHEYWLYGSRLEDDVTFRWGLGGLPISYTDWSTGQPDNAGGQQRCMKLFKTILWDDDNCFSKYYAVCQKY